jgi:hypothetical protein
MPIIDLQENCCHAELVSASHVEVFDETLNQVQGDVRVI